MTYHRPSTTQEVLELLVATEAVPAAGATDLLIDMRFKGLSPPGLVDISRLPFRYTMLADGEIALGALTTIAQLERSAAIHEGWACLADAAASFGSPQIRNQATVGGNIAHATPSAEMAPPLLALDAKVRLLSLQGERLVPLEAFFTGPGKTVRKSTELISEFRLPTVGATSGTAYLRHCVRETLDIAVVGVACRLQLAEDGRIAMARISLGAVAPTPIRATAAEEMLLGELPDEALFARAGELAQSCARPISDVRASAEYRADMVRVYTRRCVALAAERAKKEGKR